MPKTMMTIMMMMMMIMTDPFTTNLVVKGPVAKGSVVKGATSVMMMVLMMVLMMVMVMVELLKVTFQCFPRPSIAFLVHPEKLISFEARCYIYRLELLLTTSLNII